MRTVISDLIMGLFEEGKKYQSEILCKTMHQNEIQLCEFTVLKKEDVKIRVNVTNINGNEENFIKYIYYYEFETVDNID